MGDAGEDFQRLRRFVSVLRGAWPSRAGDANAAAASTLQLAERAADALTRPPAPAHVAVVGPTQVGKSSVVNHMLGVEAADVSPLAGHTTQAHGFQAGGAALTDWLASAFPDFAVKPSGELSREERRVIGFQRVRADFEADVVVWDTPDFDSAESAAYRAVTIDLIGLCDAVVLVVSREKYADLTVWTLLEQIAPLARELYICLNKVTPDAEAAIRASLMSRLQERLGAFDDSRVVTIPQSASIEAQRESTGTRMLRVVARNLSASDLQSRARRDIAAMSRTNWDVWTGPIVAEHAARETWHADVERALDVGFEHYVSDFLEHPERYDAFRRATVELLNLLELPGVAGALSKAREWVTWPARQLWNAGRRRLSGAVDAAHTIGAELTVFHSVIDRVLTTLSRDVARRQSQADAGDLWRALGKALEARHDALTATMRVAAASSCASFEPEIHAAANRLYAQLQERPGMLTTLRAARGISDAAAVALAVKTGGSPIHDVVLAPALFGVSTLLTEGALGSYMKVVADDLKRRREKQVSADLFRGEWRSMLRGVVDELNEAGLFGVSREELEAADAALRRMERNGR